jgi:hypothetical protein
MHAGMIPMGMMQQMPPPQSMMPAGGGGGGMMQNRPYSPSIPMHPGAHPGGQRFDGDRRDHRGGRMTPGAGSGSAGRQQQQKMHRDEPSAGSGSGPVKEYPCRTLFIRNINYETPEPYLRELFEKYGEIKRFFSLLEKRGMLFVTYYDLRDSERAKKDLQNADVYGRQIDVHFSFPKDEELQTKECDGEKNQVCVSVKIFCSLTVSINNRELVS